MAPENYANWAWRNAAEAAGEAVVFDIDGVLADASARQHFLRGVRPDWDGFFAGVHEDPLIDEVARLVDVIDHSLRVVLMTGRPLSVQAKTMAWLERHGIRWDVLIMRNFGDYSAARQFKEIELDKMARHGLNARLAFEDDERNVAMFKAHGVPCVYIHSGYY